MFLQHYLENRKSNFIISGSGEKKFLYEEINFYANKVLTFLKQENIKKWERVWISFWMSEKIYYTLLGIIANWNIPVFFDSLIDEDNYKELWYNEKIIFSDNISNNINSYSIKIESIINDNTDIYSIKYGENNFFWLDMFTSWTTGTPKRVCLNAKNIEYIINEYNKIYGLDKDNIISGFLPSHYSLSVIWTIVSPLFFKSKIIIYNEPSALKILELIEKFKINILVWNPKMYKELSKYYSKYNLSSLRLLDSWGAPLPKWLLEKLLNNNNFSILNWYGPAETSTLTHYYISKNNSDNSIWYPTSGTTIKLIDKNGNIIAEPYKIWKMLIKWEQVVEKWIKNWKEISFIDKNGFFDSWDYVYYDEEWKYFFVSRVKESSWDLKIDLYLRKIEDEAFYIKNLEELNISYKDWFIFIDYKWNIEESKLKNIILKYFKEEKIKINKKDTFSYSRTNKLKKIKI